MSKNKEKVNILQEAPKPITFGTRDPIRQTIEWHCQQLAHLYDQLDPHLTRRGMIAGVNDNGMVCMMFKGNERDIFRIKEHLEEIDSP